MTCLFFGIFVSFISAYKLDESISFSPNEIDRVSSSPSYWHGNITVYKEDSTLNEIEIEMYLNELEGRLFYAIDSKYRTLLVEFSKNMMIFKRYNFQLEDFDKYEDTMNKFCKVLALSKIVLHIKLQQDQLVIDCNGVSESFSYHTFPEISATQFDKFLRNMKLPIPYFNNVTEYSEIQLWIGNTPAVNETKSYINTGKLDHNPKNLQGCIKSLSVNKNPIQLATTGNHHGDMIMPFCTPVCQNKCQNNGKCSELWRERFRCDCGTSPFVGKQCDEYHSIEFDETFVINISIYRKFERFRFSFKPNTLEEIRNRKILSLKFLGESVLYVYIDPKKKLCIKFDDKNRIDFDIKFQENQEYTVFIEMKTTTITVKVAHAMSVDNKSFDISQNNLIVENILVGESHGTDVASYGRLMGCVSNVILTSDQHKFMWNEIANFTSYPPCGTRRSYPTPAIVRHTIDREDLTTVIQLGTTWEKVEKQSSTQLLMYIIISILVLIILLTAVVTVLICLKQRKTSARHKRLTPTASQRREDESTDYLSLKPPAAPQVFKPAYNARSMSFSSTTGRSVSSLPISINHYEADVTPDPAVESPLL